MSAEEASSVAPSSPSQTLLQIQQSLHSCSQAVESGDFSQDSILKLSEFLGLISDDTIFNGEDDETLNNAIDILSHIHSHLSNPELNQEVIDAFSFELPKAIAKFAGASQKCSEIVDSIIDLFTTKCGPRDMITVYSEALAEYGKTTDAPGYVASLLRGVSKVLLSIERRPFEQIKVAVPIILNAVKEAASYLDDGDEGLMDLFKGAVNIANSIQSICKKLEGHANEQLRAWLGLYILQITTVISISMGDETASCLCLIQELSNFFPYCGLSYHDLIAGQGVDPLLRFISDDDTNDFMDCFSYANHGAVLSVIWAAEQDIGALKNELRSAQNKRWSAMATLKYIYCHGMFPWTLKKRAINFLLDITENVDQQERNEDIICSLLNPSVISTLQAIVSVVMNAPDAELRKNAWIAFKRVVLDNPPSLRLDIMQVLVRTCSSSTMKALLLDCVRENLRSDYIKLQEGKINSSNSFWDAGILDLLELVLSPPDGGPSFLPEQSDAVLSGLNLYRYVLITESTGKTNYTKVLTRSNLQKVYNEWILPLRTLVRCIISESKNERDQLSMDIICGLNPLEFVLYRCVELVEEKLEEKSP